MKTEKRKVGDVGEEIASKFLEKHGFRIVMKNYLRKWGEIDIIAEKEKVLHFIEVKSKSVETFVEESDDYRPEEQVHKWKVERLHRAIASYLMENKFEEREYQLDIVVVLINFKDRKTRVRYLPSAI